MIDTHCHLNFPELFGQLEVVLERASKAGVTKMVVPATDLTTSLSTVDLSIHHPHIFSAIGIHPTEAGIYQSSDKIVLADLIQPGKSIVSIGEVGLDFYHFEGLSEEGERECYKEKQRLLFREMLALAKEKELPVIIHSREAFEETKEIMAREANNYPAVIHCFSGNREEAQYWLEAGYLLSFTAMITYPKNEALRTVVKEVPLERMMLETDAPFLAPQGFRGELNEPRFVKEVANCVAEVKGISYAEVNHLTTATAERFFKI